MVNNGKKNTHKVYIFDSLHLDCTMFELDIGTASVMPCLVFLKTGVLAWSLSGHAIMCDNEDVLGFKGT
jgi:hypothetical protein